MNSMPEIPPFMKIVYWITTTVCAIIFLITGIGNLVPFAHIAHDMARLGYPQYFMKILGFWKVVAGLVIILPLSPRVKTWAYAGMYFDLSGAALSRFFANDALTTIIVPLMLMTPVTVSYLLSIKMPSAKQLHSNAKHTA